MSNIIIYTLNKCLGKLLGTISAVFEVKDQLLIIHELLCIRKMHEKRQSNGSVYRRFTYYKKAYRSCKLNLVQCSHWAWTPLSVIYTYIYRASQKEFKTLRESVPYVKLYRYNPKHLYPKFNGYGDNDHRKVWSSLRFHALYLVRDVIFGYCTHRPKRMSHPFEWGLCLLTKTL
jgi:hypothetical protein